MKQRFFLLFIVCVNSIHAQSTFEGILMYHHKRLVNGDDLKSSKHYYDTLKVIYKDLNFIKVLNKLEPETHIFIDSLETKYSINEENENGKKTRYLYINNLDNGKLYHRENNELEEIISLKKSDTTLTIQNKKFQLKHLIVKRKYGTETFIYSENDSLKLAGNRNVLKIVGLQIHKKQIAEVLNKSLLFYYRSEGRPTYFTEFSLFDIQSLKLKDSTFNIPMNRDETGLEDDNKLSKNRKVYRLIDGK